MKAGILALQGDVELHEKALKRQKKDIEVVRVKSKEDLKDIDILIFPGGESPTMSKLLERYGLKEDIVKKITIDSVPTLATCAGIVMLSTLEKEDGRVSPLKILDVVIERNGFGRQKESFESPVRIKFAGEEETITGIFIRAPRIKEIKGAAQPVAYLDNEVVGILENNIIALTFHPELADDTDIIYKKLFSMVK